MLGDDIIPNTTQGNSIHSVLICPDCLGIFRVRGLCIGVDDGAGAVIALKIFENTTDGIHDDDCFPRYRSQ